MSQYHCNEYFLINQNRSRRRCHDNKSNFGRIHSKYNSSFSTLDDQKSLTKYLFHTMLQRNSKLLIKMVTRYIILFKQMRVAVGKNFFVLFYFELFYEPSMYCISRIIIDISYLELFVAVIGGSHWMCMIQMKCMSVTLSDQQAVYHVSVDVAHNHSKSIFPRKNSLVKWIKNGAFLVHQNISKSL